MGHPAYAVTGIPAIATMERRAQSDTPGRIRTLACQSCRWSEGEFRRRFWLDRCAWPTRQECFAYASSVLAAMMKSLRWSPLIAWVHQLTVTLPHSSTILGW